jgi:hypothetical protein
MARARTSAILLWRPVLLLGGGMLLAGFEAIQPLLGHAVEWAIVSLAATMMGLELWQRSQPPNDDKANPEAKDAPAPAAAPDTPGKPGNPAALAVRVALAGLGSRKAPAAVVVAVV